MAKKDDRASLAKVIEKFDKAKKHHDGYIDKVERRWRSYYGIVERTTTAAASTWNSKYTPHYVLPIVETIVANMVDDKVRFAIRPRPYMASVEEIGQRQESARALEHLLRYQLDMDRFHEKQRPFMLQASIAGVSVGKVYWRYERGEVVSRRPMTKYYEDPYSPDGLGQVTTLEAQASEEVTADDPTFEVRDIRDWFFPESAVSVDAAPWLIDRTWKTFDELKRMERLGLYKNVDELKESKDFRSEYENREEGIFQRTRTKDLIEVLEYWDREAGKVCTVANRNVLLKEEAWPFWHGMFPFVTLSTTPNPFQIEGVSDVELVAELQEMIWTFQNTRLDQTLLATNAPVIMNSQFVEDPDAFEFYPGARNIVDGPVREAVDVWHPDTTASQVSIAAEGMIRGDMQTTTGFAPFLSGSDNQGMDQKTATGVSIITSLAQRRTGAKKQHALWAFRRVAEQFIALDQQFLTEPKDIEVTGRDGASTWVRIEPGAIQGRYGIEVDPVAEQTVKSERLAQKQSMVQVASQVAPVAAAMGTPLNYRAFVEDWLRAADIDDIDKYFSAAPQQLPPGQSGQPSPEEQGPGGVTSPTAYSPNGPNASVSASPVAASAAMQRMSGGTTNQGGQ